MRATDLNQHSIVEDYRQGVAIADLAIKHDVGIHLVYTVLKKHNVVIIKGRFRKSYVPHNKNDIQDKDIVKLHLEKHSFSEIARLLGRTRRTITSRAYAIGLKSAGFDFGGTPTNLKCIVGETAAKSLLDHNWLHHEYIILNKSSRQIAAELGCGKKAVLGALRRLGLPIQRPGVNKDVAAQKRRGFITQVPAAAIGKLDSEEWMRSKFIDENLSGRQISKSLGVSLRCVYCWVKRHNLIKSDDAKRASDRHGFGVGWVNARKGGRFWCHSSWEKEFALFLDKHPSIESFRKDDIKIAYRFGGQRRNYYPDFNIKLISGAVLIVEIKADRWLSHKLWLCKLSALKKYAVDNACDYLVLGGKNKLDLSPFIAHLSIIKN